MQYWRFSLRYRNTRDVLTIRIWAETYEKAEERLKTYLTDHGRWERMLPQAKE